MATVSLSKRGYIVFKRWIETKFDSMIKEGVDATDNNDEDVYLLFNNNWKIELAYFLPCHKEGCDDEDTQLLHGNTCDKCANEEMTFSIYLRYSQDGMFRHSSTILEYRSLSFDHVSKEMLFRWLDSVETKNKWTICRCGQRATMNEACDSCYIHGYVRSEEEGGDCCVCHENDGRWIKQQCGHVLHIHCFLKIKMEGMQRKCPLCRASSEYTIAQVDCYDV